MPLLSVYVYPEPSNYFHSIRLYYLSTLQKQMLSMLMPLFLKTCEVRILTQVSVLLNGQVINSNKGTKMLSYGSICCTFAYEWAETFFCV